MSTYNDLEISTERSRPIELYRFTLGAQIFRYTSAEDEITVGIETFLPESIARGNVEQGSDSSNRAMILTVPSANPFAVKYVNVVPGERASVDVLRYQRDEVPLFATVVLLFKAIVQAVRFPNDGHTAEIAIKSIESVLARNVPRFTYTGMCNNFLFDSRCGVNPAAFNYIGPVTAVAGNVVTVGGAGASGLDLVGGYCRPVTMTDFRMVVAQAGDDLTLLLPFPVDITGINLQCFSGCDHLVDGDCALVFDNVSEFGGFAVVPNRNIFMRGIQT